MIGHPEEGRYVQLRKEWKRNLALRFLFFFEFQALLDVFTTRMPFLAAVIWLVLETLPPTLLKAKIPMPSRPLALIVPVLEMFPVTLLLRTLLLPNIAMP